MLYKRGELFQTAQGHLARKKYQFEEVGSWISDKRADDASGENWRTTERER